MKEDTENWYKVRVLGSGGFGDVVLWNNHEKEEVAVKKCRIQNSISQDAFNKLKARWCQEVDWLQQIKTEYIVQTVHVDYFLKNINPSELPILVMEYCDGGDLRSELNLVKNSSGFTEFEICTILKSLRNAVSYLHNKYKITHRDIKPENIVIKNTKDGRKLYKLTDLGYAKLISVNTVEASMVGTKDYFAPEIITNFEYSNSVDYWSIGVIGFELITGVRPFVPHQSMVICVDQIKNKAPNVIAITENNDGQFIKHTKIFQENQICECFKKLMENWLSMALEYNRKSRGEIVEIPKTENNQTQPVEKRITFFDRLDLAINSHILTVFSLSSYEFYSYQINENTTMIDLVERIEKTTGIVRNDLYLFTPHSHNLIRITQNTRPIDLFMENWTENRPMLYVTRFSEEKTKPKAIYMPSVIKFVINEPNLQIKNFVLQEYVRNSLFLLRNEEKYYLVHLDGLKNYALTLETEILDCNQKIDQIRIETYKIIGSSDTLIHGINYGINLVSKIDGSIKFKNDLVEKMDSVIYKKDKLSQISQNMNIRYNSILKRIQETIKSGFLNNTCIDFFNVKKMEKLYDSMTASNKTDYLKVIGELIAQCIKNRSDFLTSLILKKTRTEILYVHVEFQKIKNIIASVSNELGALTSQINSCNEQYQTEILKIGYFYNQNQPISNDIDMPNMDELTQHLNLDNGSDYLQPRIENESVISNLKTIGGDDTQNIINESHHLILALENMINDVDMT